MPDITRRTLLRLLAALPAALPLCACLPKHVNAASPEERLRRALGQLLLVGFRGTDAPEGSPQARDLAELNVAGLVLFDYDTVLKQYGRNIQSPEQLARLTAQLRKLSATPPLLAVDQEGGRVQRLKQRYGFLETPSAAALGLAGADTSATLAAGRDVGAQLARMGLNVDFAPVLDVNRNPHSPAIGAVDRSFSADPALVAAHGAAFARGLRSQGVLTCVKHFPGHGSAREDSHLGLPDVTGLWSPVELEPFRELIRANLADMVMTAHLFNSEWDDVPASLSQRVIGGMLRRDLGFDGVVVSDDLNMEAVAGRYGLEEAMLMALDAGCDLLLFGNNLRYDPDIAPKALDILCRNALSGRLAPDRLQRSFARIARLKTRML
ncbi:beta-N-acetylhexosaminidase [Paucidesulfovibrio longus]|uniref:beta-N-acetylhexosaminidase n=1 Tax=Paucidesulfovibrio longus TaxID=889 RepID=UPI0003B4AAE8|nr:beta-N-acetylhexosaminidase [Paucidesulfovibrio longus]